jgi:site-specific recombinase XerC
LPCKRPYTYQFLAMMFEDAPANLVNPKRHFIRQGQRLPREVQDHDLERLFAIIQSPRDRAMFLLMLRCDLDVGEVRNLSMEDLYLYSIPGSLPRLWLHGKGGNERVVYLSAQAMAALEAWLAIRGEAEYLSDEAFVFHHKPLSRRYCGVRLRTYGQRGEFQIAPHQLRHSCATLLLNAGAPLFSVQSLLGHERVDTTLGYARLYDGTIAADYYRAMGQIERLFEVPKGRQVSAPTPAELVALVDSLNRGTLNERQRQTVQALREGLLSLAMLEEVQV